MDISKLVPEWVRTLTPYQPGKPIEELEREYGVHDSIKIASNENPLGPSPKAVAAITEALKELHRYPDGDCFYLKRRLSEKLGIDRSRVILGNGSNELIEMLVRTFLRVGESIVAGEHAFAIYHLVAQAAGGRTITGPHKGFQFDLAVCKDGYLVRVDDVVSRLGDPIRTGRGKAWGRVGAPQARAPQGERQGTHIPLRDGPQG